MDKLLKKIELITKILETRLGYNGYFMGECGHGFRECECGSCKHYNTCQRENETADLVYELVNMDKGDEDA